MSRSYGKKKKGVRNEAFARARTQFNTDPRETVNKVINAIKVLQLPCGPGVGFPAVATTYSLVVTHSEIRRIRRLFFFLRNGATAARTSGERFNSDFCAFFRATFRSILCYLYIFRGGKYRSESFVERSPIF